MVWMAPECQRSDFDILLKDKKIEKLKSKWDHTDLKRKTEVQGLYPTPLHNKRDACPQGTNKNWKIIL